jgi:hypothetical protein
MSALIIGCQALAFQNPEDRRVWQELTKPKLPLTIRGRFPSLSVEWIFRLMAYLGVWNAEGEVPRVSPARSIKSSYPLLTLFSLFVLTACGGGGSSGSQGGTPPPPPLPALTSRSTFRRTDMNPRGVVYDPSHKLVFVTVPQLNEVVVYSSTNAGTVAAIPVPDPSGIDITADASRVIVGTNTRFFWLIDTVSLQLTRSVLVPTS